MSEKQVYIRLLGTFHVTREGQEVSISTSQARRVLAFLALHPQTSRTRVVAALFTDFAEERARRALSQALWRLRSLLGADVIQGDYVELHLGPHVGSDVAEFAEKAKSPHLEDRVAAVRLYQGDFWPDNYEEWALVAREKLREQYLGLLEELIQSHKQAGKYREALFYARLYVQEEPLREDVHHELMRLYLILEQPQTALRQYETLEALLAEEMGVQPSPELQALAQVIRERLRTVGRWKAAPLFTSPERIPFVGRHHERGLLLEKVEQAQRGYGSMLFVEGPPGMGKSRLLSEVQEGARWREVIVGYGQAPTMAAPFTPLQEAVAEVLEQPFAATLYRDLPAWVIDVVARIWPQLGTGSEHPPLHRSQSAIVQLLLALAQRTPLMLILDDIHNADTSIFPVLQALTSHLPSIPLLVVLAYRPLEARGRPEVWEGLKELDRMSSPTRLTLQKLTEQEQHLLISAALGIRTYAPLVATLSKLGGHVPLHLLETLRFLYRRGYLKRTTAGEWALDIPDELVIPPTVTSLVQQRVQRLPQPLQHILNVFAVLGERFPQTVVDKVLQTHTITTLQDLKRHGFLVNTDAGWAFSHVLVREAVYQQIPPEQRRRFHGQVAQLLKTLPHPPWDQIAYHLQLAGQPMAAVQAFYQAAQEAAHLFALDRTVEHCQATLELLKELKREDVLGCQVRLLLAETWMLLGAQEKARHVVAETILLARRLQARHFLAKALLTAGKIIIRSGDYTSAQRFLERAYTLYESLNDIEGMTHTLLFLGDVAENKGQLLQAHRYVEEALQLLPQLEESPEYSRVLSRQGMIAARLGHLEEAETLYRQSVTLARRAGDLYMQGLALNGLGLIALERREHTYALQMFTEVLAIAQRLRDAQNTAVTLLNLGVASGNAGYWQEAFHYATDALHHIHEHRGWRTLVLTHLLLSFIYIMWGRFGEAAEHLDKSERIAKQAGFVAGLASLQRTRGVWHREQGHLEEAIASGEEGVAILKAHRMNEKLPVALYSLGCSLLLAQEYTRAIKIFSSALEHTHTASLRAFLQAALAVAHAETNALSQAAHHAQAGLAGLEHVESDEYLPTGWYHLARWAQIAAPQEAPGFIRRAYMSLLAQRLHVPESVHHSFLHNVLTHRLIMQAWLQLGPWPIERLSLQLPAREGKAHVQVLWTINAGDEDALVEARYGPVALRRHRIRRLLQEAEQQGARATHQALAHALGVSVPTIRRDLHALQKSTRHNTLEEAPDPPSS